MGDALRPPRLLEWLLGRFASDDDREAMLGDAAEEWAARVRRHSAGSARRWYRRQVVSSIAPGIRGWLTRRTTGADLTNPEGEGVFMWTRDLRLGLRSLLKRPGFTATIVTTLSVGVGTTTALFGVFKAVFLEPLDLPDSNRIVVVMETAGFGCCGPASGPDYLDWVERHRSFESIAALHPGFFNLTGLETPERVYATHATASAFELVGVEPMLGRGLVEGDQVSGGVVVLGHSIWNRAYGGRSDAVGEMFEINGEPYTIVGVMPAGFDIPSPWGATRTHEFYVPFLDETMDGNRGNHSFPVIARLSDDSSVEAAQLDMERVMRELEVEYPVTNESRSVPSLPTYGETV